MGMQSQSKIDYVMDCIIGTQLQLKIDYVMECAIGMQLYSHGLVKNLRHRLRNRDAITFPRSS